MTKYVILRLKNLIQLAVIIGIMTFFFDCTTKSNVHLNSTSKLKNCQKDSLSIQIDTLKSNFDIQNIQGVIHSKKDANGVWFDDPINDQLRIVYKAKKRILLVYFNHELYVKYSHVIPIVKTYNRIRCINGKFIEDDKPWKYTSISSNYQTNIIEISQNWTDNFNSSISFSYNASNKYKATVQNLYLNTFDTLDSL